MPHNIDDVRMEKVFGKWVRHITRADLDEKHVKGPINRQAARCSVCDSWTRHPIRCKTCHIVEYCSDTCSTNDSSNYTTHKAYCLRPYSVPLPVDKRYQPSISALFLMAVAVVKGNRSFFIEDPVTRAMEIELVCRAEWGGATPAKLITRNKASADDSFYRYPHLYNDEWLQVASQHFYPNREWFDYWSCAEEMYKRHPLSADEKKVTDVNCDLPINGKLFTIDSTVMPAVKAQLSLIYDKLATAQFLDGTMRLFFAETMYTVEGRRTIFTLHELIIQLFNRYVIDIPVGDNYEFNPADHWSQDEDMQVEDWFDTEKHLWEHRARLGLPQNEVAAVLQKQGWRIECVSVELRERINGPRPVVRWNL